MSRSGYDVFISYRRDGGDTLAQLIYDRLTERGYRVFLDIESLRSGKFNEKLLEVISQCRDLVVILPPGALERCREEGDWLYLELSHALGEGKNIVPVMMKGFAWPEDMPAGLEELKHFNGIQDSKDYFDAVIDKMTALLQSRASVSARLVKKIQKRKKHFRIKKKIKIYKKFLAGILAAGIVAAAAIIIPKLIENQNLQEEASRVNIQITPDEEMSASEYYDAREILKQRFDILAEGFDYEIEMNDDTIDVNIPIEVFHDIDVEAVLKSCVIRPAEIYVERELTQEEIEQGFSREENGVYVDRKEIVDLSIGEGSAKELNLGQSDMDRYGIEKVADDRYKYLEIEFSDDVCREIEGTHGYQEVYRLIQDEDQFGVNNAYYYPLIRSERENVFYIVDCWQEDNIYNLSQYNYTHETFSGKLSASILMPVEWETAKNAEVKGKFQCDIDEIEAPYVTMQLFTYSEDVSEGEYHDILTALKGRMDALEMPYAFGETVDDSMDYGVSIRTSTERMGPDIIEMIGEYPHFSVEGTFYQLIFYVDFPEFQYTEQSNGSYDLKLKVPLSAYDNAEQSYEELAESIKNTGTGKLYLSFGNENLLSADAADAMQGDEIIFHNVDILGLDAEDDRQKYLLQLLEQIRKESGLLESSYSVSSYQIKRDENGAGSFGIPSRDEEREAEYERIIQELAPQAEVEIADNTLNVDLNLDIDEKLPEKAYTLLKEIYKACDMESGELGSLSITCISKSGNVMHCTFTPDRNNHCMEYYGSCYGEDIDAYKESFRNLVEQDEFFKEEVKSSEYIGGWNFEGDF